MGVKQKFLELAKQEMRGTKHRYVSQTELNQYFSECGGIWKQADRTTSWCGIFATYLLRKAGAQVKWEVARGIFNHPTDIYEPTNFIQRINGNAGLSVGDIAVRGKSNHHFIVLDPPDAAGNINCIEGNYGGVTSPELHQGPRVKNNLSGVYMYYKVF